MAACNETNVHMCERKLYRRDASRPNRWHNRDERAFYASIPPQLEMVALDEVLNEDPELLRAIFS